MNSETFVEALRQYVLNAAVDDAIANLKRPPGRSVSANERLCSEWYNALSSDDADKVRQAAFAAAHGALFGVLAVLDGSRTIDDENGTFELTYTAKERVLLNDPDAIGLHELLNATDR